jgi:hypothetical protein
LESIIIKILLNLFGFAFFSLLVYLLYQRAARVAIIAFLAATVSFYFGNLDRIEFLRASAAGFESKTREVINEAENTIALLRKLAVLTASLQVKMLAAEGRLQGPASLLQKDEQKDRLLQELKKIGLKDDELAEVAAADSPWIKWDYVVAILQPINSTTNCDLIRSYDGAYMRFTNPLSPDETEEILGKFQLDNAESRALIEDYRYYLKHGKHRRPEVWRTRPVGLRTAPSVGCP